MSFLRRTTQSVCCHAWALLCLGLIAAVYFAWSDTDQMGAFANDGPCYLMMARHYAPAAHESVVYAEYATYSRFPPLYPLMLAVTGTGAELHATHRVTTVFLLAALGAYYAWLLAAGAARPLAALLTLLVAVLPASWLQALTVQSEYLYLFWSLLALSLLTLYERPAVHGRRHELLYAAAIAVAAAVLTRTIGVALFVPLLLAARQAPRRAALLAVAAGLLPPLAWHMVHRSRLGYDQALGDMYGHHAWQFLLNQVGRELPALRAGFADDFLHAPLALRWLADGLGLLLLAGSALRALRLKPDGTYMAAYLAIVLVWPYPEEAWRFLWVVLPIALFQWLLALAELLHEPVNGRRPEAAAAVLAVLVLVMALPSIELAAGRYDAASEEALVPARGLTAWYDVDEAAAVHSVHAQLVLMAAMRRIGDETPADACVIAVRTDLINYYSDRRSFQPPLNSVPDPYFQELLRAHQCGYVFMSTMRHMMFPLPLHPAQRLGDRIQVLDYVDERDQPPAAGQVTAILAVLDAAQPKAP